MGTRIFERTVSLPVSAAEAFAWHEREGAFERLAPPWERIETLSRVGGVRDGAVTRLRAKTGPVWVGWEVEHRDHAPGKLFRDTARRGPFARWDHRHEFADTADGACELRDRIEYALPGGAAGEALAGGFVRRKLDALFRYRHAVTREDLRFSRDHAGAGRMRVLVSGASGLVGRALTPFLTTQGHEVLRLVRRAPRAAGEVEWEPEAGRADLGAAGEIDAVVHLAGAGIADGRWTEARRRVLRDSRVRGTRTLAAALAARPRPPRVVVGASGAGFYGDTGDAWVDETSPVGAGFLAGLTEEWEAAWAPLDGARTRRVYLRTGVVLSPAGGALAKMLTPFRLGLGGPMGSGRQWFPWISIDDLVGVIGHALASEGLRGPVNAVGPEAVTNAEFARGLGRVLHRPAGLSAPAWALRLALGRGLTDEALLTGQRVRAGALAADGYRFRHETVAATLRHVLGRV